MNNLTKHYTKDNITVIWQPGKCIHSKNCWNGLRAVFNPDQHPWINMDGATLERITDQVSHCPSGALSYIINNEEKQADDSIKEITTSVEAVKNGPLIVYGNIVVKDAKGNEAHKNKVTAFCRCGGSSNKPFCDGTHLKIGFKDE